MQLILVFLIIVLVLGALDLAALRWGVNSRQSGGDWNSKLDNESRQIEPRHL